MSSQIYLVFSFQHGARPARSWRRLATRLVTSYK